MNRAELLLELEQARRPCPVCSSVIVPSRESVRVLVFPLEDGRLALLPVHDHCLGEAVERLRRARAGVAIRELRDGRGEYVLGSDLPSLN